MKLSFSISSSSSKAKRSSADPLQPQPSADDDTSRTQYVTVFDPSQTLTTSTPVVAPIANTNIWRASSRMKNLVPPSSDSTDSASQHFVVAPTDATQPSGPAYGLTIRSKSTPATPSEVVEQDPCTLADATQTSGFTYGLTLRPKSTPAAPTDIKEEPRSHPSPIIDETQRYKTDIPNHPADRGIQEFEEIGVEDFGRALLAGYGWKEGQGIGRNLKEDVKIFEPKRLGAGSFVPDSDGPGAGVKNREKNGKSNGKPPLPPREAPKVVRVIDGEYTGMKGEVLRNEKEIVVLRLLSSGERITLGAKLIAELGSAEEERCIRKQKDAHRKGNKRERSEERNGTKVEEKQKVHHRSMGGSKDATPVHWLRSMIKVRVISKDFMRGRLYLKKGVVIDVSDPLTCDISLDDGRELIQGVEEGILETVIPPHGGPVIVLYGRHKGVYGKLVEKDREKEVAVVRNADNHDLIKVHMDQIAEYVGDPDDIGY